VPAQPHGSFSVEVESAHRLGALHHGQQRRDRIDAKSEQRIPDAAPGFKIDERVRNTSPKHPQYWRIAPKSRHAQNHRHRIHAGKTYKLRDQRRRMLPI
jgi:hypothetical protein